MHNINLEKFITPQDMEKAIHYLNMSSSNNNSDANFLLGCINILNKSQPIYIDKGIHYLTLSTKY